MWKKSKPLSQDWPCSNDVEKEYGKERMMKKNL
jgi:hypothetical protein